MGVGEPVLELAYVSKAADCSGDLYNIICNIASRVTCFAPREALQEWGASCEHGLIVVDGYSLGTEALMLCKRLRFVGLTQPIVLAWMRDTDLDRAACREYGVDEVVIRPFAISKLSSIILSIASNWRPRIKDLADDDSRTHSGYDGLLATDFTGAPDGRGGRAELRMP